MRYTKLDICFDVAPMTATHALAIDIGTIPLSLEDVDAEITRCGEDIIHAKLRKIVLLRAHNAAVPIGTLPSESLLQIFRETILNGSAGGWHCLAGICHRWRVVSLGYPRLWSTLHNPSLSMASTFVSRSADVPLTIRLHSNFHVFPRTLKCLTDQVSRIQRLSVTCATVLSHPMFKTCLWQTWPCVEEIDFDVGDTQDSELLFLPRTFSAPRLQSLVLRSASFELSARLFHANLRRLHVDSFNGASFYVHEWLRTLAETPLLEDLHLSACFAGLREDKNLTPITLAHLKEVEVEDYVSLLAPFLCSICPASPVDSMDVRTFVGVGKGDNCSEEIRHALQCHDVVHTWTQDGLTSGGVLHVSFKTGPKNSVGCGFSLFSENGLSTVALNHVFGMVSSEHEQLVFESALMSQARSFLSSVPVHQILLDTFKEEFYLQPDQVVDFIAAIHSVRELVLLAMNSDDKLDSDWKSVLPTLAWLAGSQKWRSGDVFPLLEDVVLLLAGEPTPTAVSALQATFGSRSSCRLHLGAERPVDKGLCEALNACTQTIVWESEKWKSLKKEYECV